MSFNVQWPEFSKEFLDKAREQLTVGLNKGEKPANIVDRIVVTELNMGTRPPDLELLEIGELSAAKFRGVLKMTYAGNGYLVLQTKVQANPLTATAPQHMLLINPQPEYLAAHQPLVVPMQLKLSQLRLRGICVLVVDKFRGVTVAFKNDPLEHVHVSSTFDNVPNIQRFLQGLIERQLRQLLLEDLPLLIHTYSLRYIYSRYRLGPAPGPAPFAAGEKSHTVSDVAHQRLAEEAGASDSLEADGSRPLPPPLRLGRSKWLGNDDVPFRRHPFDDVLASSSWQLDGDRLADAAGADTAFVYRRPLHARVASSVASSAALGSSGLAALGSAGPQGAGGDRPKRATGSESVPTGSSAAAAPALSPLAARGGLSRLFDPEPLIPQTLLRHQLWRGSRPHDGTQSDIFDREAERRRLVMYPRSSRGGPGSPHTRWAASGPASSPVRPPDSPSSTVGPHRRVPGARSELLLASPTSTLSRDYGHARHHAHAHSRHPSVRRLRRGSTSAAALDWLSVPPPTSRIVLEAHATPLATHLTHLMTSHHTISPYVQGWGSAHVAFRSTPHRHASVDPLAMSRSDSLGIHRLAASASGSESGPATLDDTSPNPLSRSMPAAGAPRAVGGPLPLASSQSKRRVRAIWMKN